MSNARYQGRLAANKAESDIRSLRAEMDTWEKTKDKKRSRDALRQALQTLENKAAALATRRTRERPKPYSDVDEKAMKDKIADINNMAFTEEDKSKIRKEFDTRQNAKLKSADDGAKALGDLIHENHLEELREILPKFCGKLLIHLGTNYGRQESEDGALDWPAALVLHGTIHGGEAHLTKIINDREQERAKLGTESIALTEKWAKKEAELKEALKEADTKAAEAMKKGQNETSDEVMSLKSLAIVSNIIQSAAEIQANAGLVTEILPVCIQTLVAMIKEKESFCGGLIALTSVSDDKLTADAMKGAGAEMKKKVKDKFLETCLEENLEDDDTKPLAEFLVKTTKLMAFKDLSTLDDEESKASRLVQKQYKGAVTKGKLGADQELEVGMLAGKVHEEVDSFWNEYEKQYIDEHKYANRRAAGQVAFAPVVAFCATLPEVTEITARILEEGNRVNELIKADQKAIQE